MVQADALARFHWQAQVQREDLFEDRRVAGGGVDEFDDPVDAGGVREGADVGNDAEAGGRVGPGDVAGLAGRVRLGSLLAGPGSEELAAGLAVVRKRKRGILNESG